MLLINLGTPERARAGRGAALSQANSCPIRASIEIPQLVWQPILRGIILTHPAEANRPTPIARSGPRRARRSPSITARQAKALAGAFGADVIVDHAMRYGKPAIAERIDALKAAGCERILIAPLYPQYCAATTATAQSTRPSAICAACAGSRRSAPCRLIMTIRPISAR